MALVFTIDKQANRAFVHLMGSLTLGPQLSKFARQVDELLSAQGVAVILLNMRGVEEIDSAGLGELVVLYTAAGQKGCSLGLLQPSARIRRTLEMTRLSDLFQQFSDEKAANSWADLARPR
jgi:anti-anti-sigma factor